MKKILLLLLGSLVILVFMLQQWVGLGDIWNILVTINPVLLPFIIVMPFVTLMVYSYRWRLLLRSVDVDVNVNTVFRYALIGAVFNYITPMLRFGGEPVKAYMLAKEVRVHKRKIFASVAMDTLITFSTLIGLIYFSALGLSFLNILNWFTLWAILGVLLLPLTLGTYFVYDKRVLIYISKKASRIASKIRPGAGKGLPGDMLKFRENLKKSLRRKDLLVKSMAIGITERMLEIFTVYMIFVALGIQVDVFVVAITLGVGIFAGGLPLLPGGVLVYESSTIFILTLLGVATAPATSAILVWRFVNYLLVIIVGIVFSWFYGISFSLKKKEHFFKFGS
ncbi:MAG: flippase-like domain-containing protein [Candidatus Aenigmatarchaeota archaeon]|nr:MAG: flippase-like domain-containing protein [Candidatus Aenigmarchaeota archaeon]